MILETDQFSIFWGDSNLMLPVKDLEDFKGGKPLFGDPWDTIRLQIPGLRSFFFAHQVHGGSGNVITSNLLEKNVPWTVNGDYLISSIPEIGTGVLTADCLPIMIYDPVVHVSAAIHAGWRSSVAGIVGNAIEHMREAFGSQPSDLKLFFGPCAGNCCYQVGERLIDALRPDAELVIETRGNVHYFDLTAYNRLLAIRAGVGPLSIDTSAQMCTICNPQFCSWRRQGEKAGRQISIICLK